MTCLRQVSAVLVVATPEQYFVVARTVPTRSVHADGTNTYLYGNGRLAQYQAEMRYFGADGLGSILS